MKMKRTRVFHATILVCGTLNATIGCDGTDPSTDKLSEYHLGQAAIALQTEPVTVTSSKDSSAAPVHIQIKTCTTTEASGLHNEIDCVVDPEYALVGGGAAPISEGHAYASPFLTESRPFDSRTWRASSSAHLVSSFHRLAVYAIGMRLDGVNTEVLRNAIQWKEVLLDGANASVQIDGQSKLLGGGAKTLANAAGSKRFLTASHPTGMHEWKASSTDHYFEANGTTSVFLLELKDEIIEGFGALEIKQLRANPEHVDVGMSKSSVTIEPGWALIGLGALVSNDANQMGRMLVSMRPGDDNRSVTVMSREQIEASAGTTQAFAVQARKRPGTHGLCNPGAAMDRWSESCVSAICSQRDTCCSSNWDSTCVSMVESVCGRSCAEHTCTPTVFEPEKWVYDDGLVVASNCYSYARNRYPENGVRQDPGFSLNLRATDRYTADLLPNMLAGDGLIPTTLGATCPDNRTKIYVEANPGGFGGAFYYHVYRQDGANGLWSDKFGVGGRVMLTPDSGDRPQHDAPQSGPVEAYFCSCNHPLPSQPPPHN